MSRELRGSVGKMLLMAGLVVVTMADSCDKQNGVVITYGPVLNAPAQCTTGSPTSTACHQTKRPITELAQVACIYSIKNTGKNAKNFLFDMANLNYKGDPQPFYNGDEPAGLKKVPNTVFVKAGTEMKNLGVIVLSGDVSGQTNEDDMGAQIPKFKYINDQNPDVPVAFVQYPPNATPKWDANTPFADATVPVCQGPN